MNRVVRVTIAATFVAGAFIAVVALRHARSKRTEFVELIATAASNTAFEWDSLVTPRFALYAQRGGYAAGRLPELRGEVDSAITHALEILGGWCTDSSRPPLLHSLMGRTGPAG
jgi:hypothetical protein